MYRVNPRRCLSEARHSPNWGGSSAVLDDLITIVFCARCVIATALYDTSIERSARAHAFSYETSPEIENSLSGKEMNGHGMSGFCHTTSC